MLYWPQILPTNEFHVFDTRKDVQAQIECSGYFVTSKASAPVRRCFVRSKRPNNRYSLDDTIKLLLFVFIKAKNMKPFAANECEKRK